MLLAQHMDAANAMSTTSGDANPAYETTMTSPATTEPAGATLLAPNAITRADPTTPRASPASVLSVPMPRPSARSPHRSLTGPAPWRRDNSGDRAQWGVQLGQVGYRPVPAGDPAGSVAGLRDRQPGPGDADVAADVGRRDESGDPVSSTSYGSYQPCRPVPAPAARLDQHRGQAPLGRDPGAGQRRAEPSYQLAVDDQRGRKPARQRRRRVVGRRLLLVRDRPGQP